MFKLVDIADARNHLRIDEANESDAVVDTFIEIASGIVLTYVKAPPAATDAMGVWKTEAVPGSVRAATLLILGELYANRESGSANPFSDAVISLLGPYRYPTWA